MAWNSTGHSSVALIAYDQLSPEDKKIITDTLKHHPRVEKDFLGNADVGDNLDQVLVMVAATWPEAVRSLESKSRSASMSGATWWVTWPV